MVPLQTKTAFSLLASPMMPGELVEAAQAQGYQAVALTDDTVLYGMAHFVRAAKKAGIQPILGVTLPVAGLTLHQPFPLVFLVENQTGYQNLLQLSSLAKTQAEALTWTEVTPYLGGLFVVVPEYSELSILLQTSTSEVQRYLTALTDVVAPEQLFLGVSTRMSDAVLDQMQGLVDANPSVRLLAVEAVEYTRPEDQFAQQVLQKLAAGDVLTNIGQAQREVAQASLPSAEAWTAAFAARGLAEAVANTDWIAAHSTFELTEQALDLPHVPRPDGMTPAAYLAEVASAGLTARLAKQPDVDAAVYQERLAKELAIIHELGFDDYFLIIWDVMTFAEREGIRTGPGRGSAAGSLVAYALGITAVDPIAYDLLFERFLNPERHEMPDIDIDLPDNERETVLDYLHTTYGHTRFAQIITFSTLGARAALRDVARVFGLKPAQIDQLAKTLPRKTELTLAEAYETAQPFQNALTDLPVDGQLLLRTAQRLEGLPRNASLHAAGIVLSAEPLVATVPVQLGEEGRLVTQLPKGPVEALGLLKMDFLALSNLTVLQNILHEVAKQDADFDVTAIDLDDAKTMALFQAGQTNGVFQFESAGMKNMLRQMKPDRFEDIVAANALFRPGPSQNIGRFIERKHGAAQTSLDPSLDAILAPTYGIIVYQEQVMRVAEVFAGFSLGAADFLRRAMSKKDATQLAQLKADFVAGAQAQGHAEALALEVYQYIETFAQYGFNRSHAVAYSTLAVQLAYLKAHYPAAFYKAVLNDAIADRKKVGAYLTEARALGVQVFGPRLNESWQGYSLTAEGQLQMGLASISGLRRDFREVLVEERRANGNYRDLADLVARLPKKYRKAEVLEPLILAGALDQFGASRQALQQLIPATIEAMNLANGSMSLFATVAPKVRVVEEFSLSEKLAYEQELLGVYVSGHPLEAYASLPQTPVEALVVGMPQPELIVYVQNVKVIRTKKGDQMAFLDVVDLTGSVSVTLFPRVYQQVADVLAKDTVLQIRGKVEPDRSGEQVQVVAEQVAALQPPVQPTGSWFVRVTAEAKARGVFDVLPDVLQQYAGPNRVVVVDETTGRKFALDENYWIGEPEAVEAALVQLLGQENVVFQPLTGS